MKKTDTIAYGTFARRLLPSSLVLLSFTALTAGSALAQVVNPSFEAPAGFTGYTVAGATSIVTSSFGKAVPDGTQQAFIDNDSTNGSVSAATLESFLNLSSGSLTGLGQGTVINGSAVQQSFTGTVGTTLSFVYDFLTSEDPTFPPYNNDFSFLLLTGPGVTGNGLVLLKNVSAATVATPLPSGVASPNLSDYLTETDYQTFSSTLPGDGTYTIAFGVVNVDNSMAPTGDIGSALLVDNIRMTAGAANAPEPSSILLALTGTGPILLAARRYRKRGA